MLFLYSYLYVLDKNIFMMDAMEVNQPDVNNSKQKKRGTRRQQRYRAKQKLLQLCELASAQTGNVIRADDKARVQHLVVVCFDIS
jgi:hypothetical protein